jgi:hypothetical protein
VVSPIYYLTYVVLVEYLLYDFDHPPVALPQLRKICRSRKFRVKMSGCHKSIALTEGTADPKETRREDITIDSGLRSSQSWGTAYQSVRAGHIPVNQGTVYKALMFEGFPRFSC